jgi:hypothetical protein
MDLTITGALIAGLALVVGTVLGAVLEDWRLRRSEKRQSERQATERLVERLDAPRMMLQAQLDSALAMAAGDAKGAERAQRRADRRVAAEVVRAYSETPIDLQRKLGTVAPAEDVIHSVEVMGRVHDALDVQEKRAWRGEPLLELSPDIQREMADVRATAERMLVFDRPSGITGRLVRWAVVHLWRPKR